MFVKNEPVAVTLDGENVVYVRGKMDLGTKAELQSRLVRMQVPILAKSQQRKNADGGAQPVAASMVNLDFGASQIATLELNIVKWEGPEFRGKGNKPIPVNSQTIRQLDPDEALVKAVLAKIDELNKPPQLPVDPTDPEGVEDEDPKNDFTPDGEER